MIDKRLESEKQTAFEPFSLVAHRINYILPFTYSDRVNKRAYADTKYGDELRKEEAEFQISFKVPMNYDDLLFDGDGLFFGMTLKSFWQVYTGDASRPFRETNYRPELFYSPLQVGSRLVVQLGWVSVLSMNQMVRDKSYRAVGTAFIPT